MLYYWVIVRCEQPLDRLFSEILPHEELGTSHNKLCEYSINVVRSLMGSLVCSEENFAQGQLSSTDHGMRNESIAWGHYLAAYKAWYNWWHGLNMVKQLKERQSQDPSPSEHDQQHLHYMLQLMDGSYIEANSLIRDILQPPDTLWPDGWLTWCAAATSTANFDHSSADLTVDDSSNALEDEEQESAIQLARAACIPQLALHMHKVAACADGLCDVAGDVFRSQLQFESGRWLSCDSKPDDARLCFERRSALLCDM